MSTSEKHTKPVSPIDQLQVYRVWGTIIVVVTLVVFTFVFITSDSPGLVITGTNPQEQTDCETIPCHRNSFQQVAPIAPSNDTVVQGFIAELREATRRAAGGEDENAWFDREKWNRENPCLSRTELPQKYTRRTYVRDLEPNPQWQAVLTEYAKLHRTCVHRVGDPTAYYMSRNTSVDCKFTVVDTATIGLGNRMLVIASAVAYAVLTKRVILLAGGEDFIPPKLLCEPFEGSSWAGFDIARNATPFRGDGQFWNKSGQFHSRIDAAIRGGKLYEDYAVANVEIQSWVGQPESRFFCDVEQEHYKNVTWVYLTGMLYFLPKYFAVPSFRPVLEALFPDRMALTRILRDVMNPADAVWTRVTNIDRGYLKHADRRLGVQLRYRGGGGEYNGMHKTVGARVLQCAINNRILPPLENLSNDDEVAAMAKSRTISVFVASLYEGVKSNLTETFLRHPTATGDGVEVVQLSHEGAQKFGGDIFQTALAEILVLSFSDFFFATPRSTFSGMAQAYGGLVPWFIDWRQNITASGPCTRAQTVDVCFQVPFDYNIRCPYDPTRHGKAIGDVFPDIQRCLDVDTGGLQLITKNDLSLERIN